MAYHQTIFEKHINQWQVTELWTYLQFKKKIKKHRFMGLLEPGSI